MLAGRYLRLFRLAGRPRQLRPATTARLLSTLPPSDGADCRPAAWRRQASRSLPAVLLPSPVPQPASAVSCRLSAAACPPPAAPAWPPPAALAWPGRRRPAAAENGRRSFSEDRLERRRRLVRDMKQTGVRVRATVGQMVAHENIYTVPNALCLTRIALTPAIGWLVVSGTYPTALACFTVAGATDLLDGWIARRFPSQASRLGSFLDPLADKLLVATLFLSLTYSQLIPLGLTLLIVARDLGLIAAASWVRYKSVPPPVTLSRYFDPTFATAQLEPTMISKMNTCLQISLVASTLAAPVCGFVDHTVLRVMWCLTAGTTVASGMVYALLQSTTYKLMGRDRHRPV